MVKGLAKYVCYNQDSLYRVFFHYTLLLLGQGIWFVLLRTSIHRGLLYQGPTRASDRSQKKKLNFEGFLGTNSWKNRPISWEFCGSFWGKLHQKAIGKKRADFLVIFKANFARNRSVLR